MKIPEPSDLAVGDFVWSIKGNGTVISMTGDDMVIELPDDTSHRTLSRKEVTDIAYVPRDK